MKDDEGVRRSWRAFMRVGGFTEVEREGQRIQLQRTARVMERLRMENPDRVSGGHTWCNVAGNGKDAWRAAWVRSVRITRRRVWENDQISVGMRADGRQRWAVDSTHEMRGKGSEREVRVRWLGVNPATLDPWEDTWVKLTWLTEDLRAVYTKSRKRRAEVIDEEEIFRVPGSKCSDRLRGDAQRRCYRE